MPTQSQSPFRKWLVWNALALALLLPVLLAVQSPLLAWRDPIYIGAGLAGVLALVIMVMQPLLAAGLFAGLNIRASRRGHLWLGGILTVLVVIHVVGLWLTSPPDVVDALLLRSPTPFSIWGVMAMWALFATAILAVLRKRIGLGAKAWRAGHTVSAIFIALSTIVHALLIDGTMETFSKIALCSLCLVLLALAISKLRVWRVLKR